jgi:hypothetical protein
VLLAEVRPSGAAQPTPVEDEGTLPRSPEAWRETYRVFTDYYGAKGSISVEGVVTDEKGRPIRGATVGFGPYGLLPFQCNRETDGEGRFRVGMLPKPPGDSADSVVAGADGYAATRIPFAKTPGNYSLSIRLKPGKVFRARVLDTEGRPVRDAFAVIVARVPEEPKWTVQYRTDSDAQGRFKWAGACAEDVAVYVGKPGSIDKIGYHALATTGRADGKEHVMKLQRLPGQYETGRPSVRVYEFVACFVEPRRSSDGRVPLFAFYSVGISFLGSRYPVQYEYGYFGCWHSTSLCEIAWLRALDDPRIPRLFRDRKPDRTEPFDQVTMLWGLPEMRRSPPPFDRVGADGVDRGSGRDGKTKRVEKGS